MKALSKLFSLLSSLGPSLLLSNVDNVILDPPDIVIVNKSRNVMLTRFLVCKDVEYSVHDLSEESARGLIESYVALLNSLPAGVQLYLIKEELDIGKLLKRISNEILNIQADLESAQEESVRVKLSIKLDKLKTLYTSLLNGKPFTRVSLIVSYRVESENLDLAKSVANYYESIITNSFRNHYGLKLERATRDNILQFILSTIGISSRPSISKVDVETNKVSQFQPINIDKSPLLNNTIILGFEKESLHPIELRVEDLFRHLAIIGPTGRGKTTLLSSIIEQVVAENLANAIAIDFKGDLNAYITKDLITVLTPVNAPINILEKPPGLEDADWRSMVVESLALASGVSGEAILKALITVENEGEHGLVKYHYTSVLLPFIEFLKNKVNYNVLVDSLNKNVLINLEGHGTAFQNAYASLCIGFIRYLLLTNRSKLRTLLAIDDAWRILRLKTFSEIVREGRSRGLGVIISTQNPDDIPKDIAENVYNIVLFGSRNKEYLKKAEELTGIKEGDIAASILRLGIGEALFVNTLDKRVHVIKILLPASMRNKQQSTIQRPS